MLPDANMPGRRSRDYVVILRHYKSIGSFGINANLGCVLRTVRLRDDQSFVVACGNDPIVRENCDRMDTSIVGHKLTRHATGIRIPNPDQAPPVAKGHTPVA